MAITEVSALRNDLGQSDGGPSGYYDFPPGCNTLNDLIEFRKMSFAEGNIFKAVFRLGQKNGVDAEYDLRKILYYATRLLNEKQGVAYGRRHDPID